MISIWWHYNLQLNNYLSMLSFILKSIYIYIYKHKSAKIFVAFTLVSYMS
jgi:hypothetical protein